MIFYFSGEGNTELVAQNIAACTHDRAISLPAKECNYELSEGENLGIITPVYFFGLPVVMEEFLSEVRFNLKGENYVFSVCTFGTISGQASHQVSCLLKKQGIQMNAQYAVRMVDVWTPLFNLTDKGKNRRVTEKALPVINRIAQEVAERRNGNFDRTKIWGPLARIFYNRYDYQRQTIFFHVMEERCVSCGLCERDCPVKAINLDGEKRPRWAKERCSLCLRCLHHCPGFAIQYGKHTVRHGQFVNPFVKSRK